MPNRPPGRLAKSACAAPACLTPTWIPGCHAPRSWMIWAGLPQATSVVETPPAAPAPAPAPAPAGQKYLVQIGPRYTYPTQEMTGRAIDKVYARSTIIICQKVGRVGQLADAGIELALRLADAARIIAQGGEAALLEQLVKGHRHGVVHVPPRLGVRVQDQGDRGVRALARRIAAFDATGGAGQDDFRHRGSGIRSTVISRVRNT